MNGWQNKFWLYQYLRILRTQTHNIMIEKIQLWCHAHPFVIVGALVAVLFLLFIITGPLSDSDEIDENDEYYPYK